MDTTPLQQNDDDATTGNSAADLIRQKLASIYAGEPNAKEELAEAEMTKRGRSKHQQFMHELHNSGKSLADIQTAWHNYYTGLPNNEKHEVWQEFYSQHAKVSQYGYRVQTPGASEQPVPQKHAQRTEVSKPAPIMPQTRLSSLDLKNQLLGTVRKRATKRRNPHIQSLIFGLSMGAVVAFFFLFGFFNERFIAPFITPSKSVSSTPIIIDPTNTSVGPEPKIIIPKINVEIPVVYTEPSIEESAVQKALEGGVLHYATTPSPGEQGNGVIFGHSSNNILNKGKYKFAFVMLKHLEPGDTFMLQKDGKRYVYRVYEKKIVKPTDVEVLGGTGKPASFTLITCDPPGTSLNRMVIIGEQITPDPNANVASTAKPQPEQPQTLAGNAPTLWQRIKNWFSS